MSRVFVEDLWTGGLRKAEPIGIDRNSGSFRRLWSGIRRSLNAVAEGVVEARRLSRLYDELATMSDRELHDIGINRIDIPTVVSTSRQVKIAPKLVGGHR